MRDAYRKAHIKQHKSRCSSKLKSSRPRVKRMILILTFKLLTQTELLRSFFTRKATSFPPKSQHSIPDGFRTRVSLQANPRWSIPRPDCLFLSENLIRYINSIRRLSSFSFFFKSRSLILRL